MLTLVQHKSSIRGFVFGPRWRFHFDRKRWRRLVQLLLVRRQGHIFYVDDGLQHRAWPTHLNHKARRRFIHKT